MRSATQLQKLGIASMSGFGLRSITGDLTLTGLTQMVTLDIPSLKTVTGTRLWSASMLRSPCSLLSVVLQCISRSVLRPPPTPSWWEPAFAAYDMPVSLVRSAHLLSSCMVWLCGFVIPLVPADYDRGVRQLHYAGPADDRGQPCAGLHRAQLGHGPLQRPADIAEPGTGRHGRTQRHQGRHRLANPDPGMSSVCVLPHCVRVARV